MLGLPDSPFEIDWNLVIHDLITIKGIFGREMYETWYMMTVMLQGGLDVRPVITHRFHYTQHEEAFAAVRSGHAGKVLLYWQEEP
jgi:threonine 3-dehydrogenase